MVIREGHGTGEGRGAQPGEAHDLGLKTAETDATKRALATFGKAFGLALYSTDRHRGRTRPTTNGALNDEAPRTHGHELPVPETTAGDRHLIRAETPVVHTPRISEPERPRGAHQTPRGVAEPADLRPNDIGLQATGSLKVPFRKAIDKSSLTLAEPRSQRDKDHLHFVAARPCLLCDVPSSRRPPHSLRAAACPRAKGRRRIHRPAEPTPPP